MYPVNPNPSVDASRSRFPGKSARHSPHTFRNCAVLLADAGGTVFVPGNGPLPENVERRLQSLRKGASTARIVWADPRLLLPGHPMRKLLPASQESATVEPENSSKSILARLAPWIATLVTASLGIAAFLHRQQ